MSPRLTNPRAARIVACVNAMRGVASPAEFRSSVDVLVREVDLVAAALAAGTLTADGMTKAAAASRLRDALVPFLAPVAPGGPL